eukprot:Lithocolla_globosa_v1_NODE_4208_length_1487_cov_3.545391.p2 type:complete len:127 gc:universal NODE_4208_length_1487_cov_3.545391:1099-1479(+)
MVFFRLMPTFDLLYYQQLSVRMESPCLKRYGKNIKNGLELICVGHFFLLWPGPKMRLVSNYFCTVVFTPKASGPNMGEPSLFRPPVPCLVSAFCGGSSRNPFERSLRCGVRGSSEWQPSSKRSAQL